jgi:hypothetical protein
MPSEVKLKPDSVVSERSMMLTSRKLEKATIEKIEFLEFLEN